MEKCVRAEGQSISLRFMRERENRTLGPAHLCKEGPSTSTMHKIKKFHDSKLFIAGTKKLRQHRAEP